MLIDSMDMSDYFFLKSTINYRKDYALENYKRCFPEDMQIHITKLPLKYIKNFFSK